MLPIWLGSPCCSWRVHVLYKAMRPNNRTLSVLKVSISPYHIQSWLDNGFILSVVWVFSFWLSQGSLTLFTSFISRQDRWLEESLYCGRERDVRRWHWERARGNWHTIQMCINRPQYLESGVKWHVYLHIGLFANGLIFKVSKNTSNMLIVPCNTTVAGTIILTTAYYLNYTYTITKVFSNYLRTLLSNVFMNSSVLLCVDVYLTDPPSQCMCYGTLSYQFESIICTLT